ncbi:MAG: hypothetical protein ACMG6E_05515 [Candidatus Roizmanbacteria bacterium]
MVYQLMRKYQTILAYYCFFIALCLIIWSFTIAPQPQGFFVAALVLPINIYFWLLISGKTAHHQETDIEKSKNTPQFGFMIALALTFSIAGILLYLVRIGIQPKKSEDISAFNDTIRSCQSDVTALTHKLATLEKIMIKLDSIQRSLSNVTDKKDYDEILKILGTTVEGSGTATLSPSTTPITNKNH